MTPEGCAGVDERYVDLHTHSTASDGSLPPREVIKAAAQINLAAIALTDHDTVDGLEEATAAGKELGIRVVHGCELSAHDKGFEIHLLVLHIRSLSTIRPHLERFRKERYERAVEMVRALNRKGIPLQFESVLQEADGGVIGRPHVARALLNNNLVTDFREAFDKYLGFDCIAYVPKPRLEARDAVAIAREAGGLVFWAHPGKDGGKARVKRLVDAGLDGLEIRHPSHTPDDIRRLSKFLDEYSLARTGGSDWHGATAGFRTLGNMNVPISWLEEHDALLNRST